MSLVIGVDPGSRITGWGLVERRDREIVYVGSGIIRPPGRSAVPERLLAIKRGLTEVIARFHPEVLAVEDVFMAKNPKSTVTLGEARGIVLLAAAEAEIPVFEYSTREVKMSVVGAGGAHKSQVAAMVENFCGSTASPRPRTRRTPSPWRSATRPGRRRTSGWPRAGAGRPEE